MLKLYFTVTTLPWRSFWFTPVGRRICWPQTLHYTLMEHNISWQVTMTIVRNRSNSGYTISPIALSCLLRVMLRQVISSNRHIQLMETFIVALPLKHHVLHSTGVLFTVINDTGYHILTSLKYLSDSTTVRLKLSISRIRHFRTSYDNMPYPMWKWMPFYLPSLYLAENILDSTYII